MQTFRHRRERTRVLNVRQFATKTTVLIVEDDADLCELYRRALTGAGYHAIGVEDGADALRRIESGTLPDVIVLDLTLPRLQGRDVYRELRARPATRRIPIVIVTGGHTEDLNPSHFECILRKPVNTDALVHAVENCIRGGRRGL